MANPFAIEPANPLQALMAGVQGFDTAAKRTKEADILAGRQKAMSALQTGGDTRNVLAELIGIGDVQGAQAIAQYAEQNANRAFRETEAQRAQRNADRSFGLQTQQFELTKQQAADAARGYEYKEVDDGQGGKTLVRIHKATGAIERPPIQGIPTEPASPYTPTQKLTEGESKDRGYVMRMAEAHKTITGLENINEGFQGMVGGVAAGRPFIRDSAAFNAIASSDRQKALQAQRNFVNAVLRRESGAVISDSEFQNAQRQYFPQPGDGPEVISQKRVNRMQAIEGMMTGAGRGFQPPADYVGTKGPAYPKDQGRVESGKRLKFNPATGEIE